MREEHVSRSACAKTVKTTGPTSNHRRGSASLAFDRTFSIKPHMLLPHI